MMSVTEQPAMLDGERSDAYIRRTGCLPPHWTNEQMQVFDAKVHERRMSGDRRWLARYGLLDD
ncbi:hypothetical protein [Nonomuraea wenchangensis]|uniref:hypothetical protein n=1 Tax=Nonomuraea wenchangensis TaxID=568860 RepID=UPI003407EE0B